MPPKTRGSKNSKVTKENIVINCKTKAKSTAKLAKLPRKALSDKTNSASDDNASCLQSKPKVDISKKEYNLLIKQRPRRERRLPSRFVEITGIQQQPQRKNIFVENKEVSQPTPTKTIPIVELSPLKTPKTILDSSLTARRPKRICRLPSKFDDHSISPSKYVPVQPAYASTPKDASKPGKVIGKKDSDKKVTPKIDVTPDKVSHKGNNKKNVNKNSNDSARNNSLTRSADTLKKKDSNKKVIPKRALTLDKVTNKVNNKRTANKENNDTSKNNSSTSSADTNNNAKTEQLPQNKTKNKENISPKSIPAKAVRNRKLVDKNFSIRILEDKKKSLKRDASNLDVYEFTYDPNEEPPPQKKKRKKPTKKREPKPKTVFFRDNYDKNLAKALRALKNTISEKSTKTLTKANDLKVLTTLSCTAHPGTDTVVTTVVTQPTPSNPSNTDKSHNSIKNYNSVRVEDIALDFEQDNYIDDVNYSPVHSPCHPTNPGIQNDIPHSEQPVHINNDVLNNPATNNIANPKPASSNDPLNLRDELSFFDDQPVASSSMNVSTRNPAASPWRVEFGSLPIKWQVNTYVKPNMTPAFESSFMNFNDSKKKHVYTNMVPDTNEDNNLPQIYEDYASKLKQTSIISFIKEVVEKNAKKKKDKMTPVKDNSLFEDLNNTSVCKGAPLAQNNHVNPKKNVQCNIQSTEQGTSTSPQDCNLPNANELSGNSIENEKESSKESTKSSSKKKKDKNVTYFGFDEENDENVSPVKKLDKRKLRALKPRARAVLQEINEQKGPTRAILPVAVKSKPIQNSDAANKLFDQMKSATEPPVFPDPVQNTESTNITEDQNNVDSNDDQSVHLFEDIEIVHNLKAHRKSYGKPKKAVTFRQNSMSDSDVQPNDVAEQSGSSDEDDLHDLTFKIPEFEPKKITRRKKPKKPKVSKKEEKEVEAWAANFNSMCEDIEEFDLLVE